MIEIHLSVSDMERADRVAHIRADHKAALGIKSNKIDEKRSEFEVTHYGIPAEIAVCRYYGVDLDTEARPGGDGGKDLMVNGFVCNVQSPRKFMGEYKLPNTNPHEFEADVAILAYWIKAGRLMNKVVVWGVCSKERMIKNGYIQDFGYGPRWCVHPSEFESPNILKQFKKEDWVW